MSNLLEASEELVMSLRTLKNCSKLGYAMNEQINKILPKDIASIVKTHSICAVLAVVVFSWIPFIGIFLAVILVAIFTWGMYLRINSKIGLPFFSNIKKTILAGIATNYIGYIVTVIIISFIPGANFISALIVNIVSYIVMLYSGILYIKVITKIFSSGVDPSNISIQDVKDIMKFFQEKNIANFDKIKLICPQCNTKNNRINSFCTNCHYVFTKENKNN